MNERKRAVAEAYDRIAAALLRRRAPLPHNEKV
jgi:hypothetical protein